MNETKLKKSRSTLLETLMSPEISILIPLIILCVYTSSVSDTFLRLKNIQVILRYAAFIGTLAVGEAFALMAGEIDLSIGTCSTLTSVVFAASISMLGLHPLVAIILALCTGALVGSVNAFFRLKFNMNSWIVTMAMQYVCLGFATVICKGKAIGGLGAGVSALSSARPLGLSWMFFIMIAFMLVTEVVVRFTPIGRKVHSVGLNVEAARIAGIRNRRVTAMCMIFSGFMGAVCGILQCVSNVAANATVGQGNEFPAIICCVIGGVSSSGGKGTMLGVLVGVIMYQTMKNCLQLLGFSANAQLVLTGIILILAVSVDILKTKIGQRGGKRKGA